MTAASDLLRPTLSVPASTPVAILPARLDDPALFINRELSWLEFNARVLNEANDEKVPLYERLKFLAIYAQNLDEFFMVRVAGLQAQISGEVEEVPPDGLTPDQQLAAISQRVHELTAEQYRIWNHGLRKELRGAGVALVSPDELSTKDQAALDLHFQRDIFPVLTPIAIDPVHPFPHVRNKSINVGVIFEKRAHTTEPAFGLVQVPTMLPRMIRVPVEGTRRAFVALEDLIFRHARVIFPQMRITGAYAFRVTRNFDIEIDDEDADDLLLTLQNELRRRERGHAVRLEVSGEAPTESLNWLCRELDIDPQRDVYTVSSALFLGDMTELTANDDRRERRDEAFTPQYVPPLRDSDDFFSTIQERDVLLHHPYESFEAVIDFLWQAAEDPKVLAIKQTLYRTGGESPLVKALQRAAELGKQVTALVELKARFDEAPNIQWARTLEDAGVHVVYGLMGLKTHCKVALVVRREGNRIKRYVHLSTGNYNPSTARIYGDLSYFTARDAYADDAGALFNLLTGYSTPPSWKKFAVAPLGLQERIIALIDREAALGAKGRIIAKMNALVDGPVIKALYRASQAGASIDLVVRGICCLRPGVPGVSDNIRVISIVDRFLEHARIFYFENGGKREVYLSSADWMPRNFQRRVEAMFPIEDEGLRDRVLNEILGIALEDNVKARRLGPDGIYTRTRVDPAATNGSAGTAAKQPPLRSQVRFMELAREKAQAGPTLPGAGGTYHVRTPPGPRAATGGTPPTPSAASPPTPPPAAPTLAAPPPASQPTT